MMWIEVIGTLSSVGLLVLIPMFLVKSVKYRKEMSEYAEQILESNRKRIEAMEKHKEAMKAHGDSLRRFTDLYEQQKRKEDEQEAK